MKIVQKSVIKRFNRKIRKETEKRKTLRVLHIKSSELSQVIQDISNKEEIREKRTLTY